MQLKVLPIGDVDRRSRISIGQIGDAADHLRGEQTVRRAYAHHEIRDLVAARPAPVALRVQAPGSKAHRQVLFRNRREAFARIALDVVEDRPRWLLSFDSLDALRRGLTWGGHHFSIGARTELPHSVQLPS